MADNALAFPDAPAFTAESDTPRASEAPKKGGSGVKWWEYALAAIPALAGGVSYGMRGQSTPDEYNEPLRRLAGRRKQEELLQDLAPIAEKYPAIKDFLPLLKYEPRLLSTFVEKAFADAQKVPLSSLPNWHIAAGFDTPPKEPEIKIDTMPGGVVKGENAPAPQASISPPTFVEDQQAFEEYKRAGQRRVDPEATQDFIARSRVRAAEQKAARERDLAYEDRIEARHKEEQKQRQADREKLETKEREGKERLEKTKREDKEAFEKGKREERDATRLETARTRYLNALAKEGAPIDSLKEITSADNLKDLNDAYTKAIESSLVTIRLDDDTERMVPLREAHRIRMDQERRRQAQEKAESLPVAKEIAAVEKQLSGPVPPRGAEAIAAKERLFRLRVAFASQYKPWENNKRQRLTRDKIIEGLKGKPREQQLAILTDMKRRMTVPSDVDGSLLTGVSADEILQIEHAIAQ